MSVKLPRTLRCEVSRFLAATIYALVALSGLSMSTAAEDGPAQGVKTPPREGGKAQAETAPENKFRAVLPDGATFELVGVGDAADDKAWWHGDGSPRTRPHYLTQFQFAKIPTPFPQTTENRIKRRFVLVCKHNGDASVTEPAIVGETKESSCRFVDDRVLGREANGIHPVGGDSSAVPRHRPPEIRGRQMDDRCHLSPNPRDCRRDPAGGRALRQSDGKRGGHATARRSQFRRGGLPVRRRRHGVARTRLSRWCDQDCPQESAC